jgi:hypothetical protein
MELLREDPVRPRDALRSVLPYTVREVKDGEYRCIECDADLTQFPASTRSSLGHDPECDIGVAWDVAYPGEKEQALRRVAQEQLDAGVFT